MQKRGRRGVEEVQLRGRGDADEVQSRGRTQAYSGARETKSRLRCVWLTANAVVIILHLPAGGPGLLDQAADSLFALARPGQFVRPTAACCDLCQVVWLLLF